MEELKMHIRYEMFCEFKHNQNSTETGKKKKDQDEKKMRMIRFLGAFFFLHS